MPSREEQVRVNEEHLAKEGIVALTVGNPAPQLTTLADDQGPVSINELLAKHERGILLFVLPALSTPNTNRNLSELKQRSVKLQASGVGVYGLAVASASDCAAYAQNLELGFPILADPSSEVAVSLACMKSGGSFPQRTTIGIDPSGKLVLFHRGLAAQATVDKSFGLSTK